MTGLTFDWAGVLGGLPLHWLATGFLTTVCVTATGAALATLFAVPVLGLRIGPPGPGRWTAVAFIELFRNTPLLVQLLFWYFVAYGLLPRGWRDWINEDHGWAALPGGVNLATPEFLAATWGLGVFFAAFLAEELRAGLLAVPKGQREAALSQGMGSWAILVHILLPQALGNAWQPLVGQYLNLMKLSSLATGIGLAEVTYQVRQIESYNSHALEAFAAGTLLYLGLSVVMESALLQFGPRRRGAR